MNGILYYIQEAQLQWQEIILFDFSESDLKKCFISSSIILYYPQFF